MRWLMIAVLAAVSCGPLARRVEVDEGAGGPPELGSSLNVRVTGDTVRFELHVTNVTSGPIALEFNSAQRYDFAVARPGGEKVWRWSDDQMFAQMTGRDTLAPGESRRYEVAWVARDREGEYTATGLLTSVNYPVELRTVFSVSGT